MSNALSNFQRDMILNVFRGVAYPAVLTNVHMAIYNGNPGRDGTGATDVTTLIRAAGRLAIPVTNWSAPATDGNGRRFIRNSVAIDWGTAASSTAATHAGFWSDATGGNYLAGGPLENNPFFSAGSPVIFAINAITLRIL